MAIDYYHILQVKPSASLDEIKTSYRKLAHIYHPDKNPENKEAHIYFEHIKEAYETLSNPGKRERYLQERWLAKATGTNLETPILSPKDILFKTLATSDEIRKMDVYRMNKNGVTQELLLLLNNDYISLLNEHNEASINNAIVKEILYSINVLPTKDQLLLLQRLLLINSNYIESIKIKEETLSGNIFWENWKPAFIILVVVLLCILIWGTSLRY